METLIFHTRDYSPPYDKACVYFTAHPEDHSTQFPQVKRDILLLQDCVIWSDSDTNRSADDRFLSELSYLNIQLIVIPVTRRLLEEPNRVVDAELPFALDHCIPVLPILMEPGLEPLYRPIFQDMQYLTTVSRDPTSVPYQERLERFLEDTLTSSKTAERVKQIFDAQIFLSYRKKDRAFAQELMQLIHKNQLLKAVGIWYDEFLIPGEGFNGGIRKALADSDLVVLTVTPNLINEDNFIRKQEYRWATVDFRKDVLPAQMEPTDREALLKIFTALSDPIDARCDDRLQQQLLLKLKDLLGKKERNPLHKYLLGIAYLHGIKTETDQSYGAGLIREAAQEGLLEAKEKLTRMYFHGHGVKRDFAQSNYWQKQVVEAYEALYRQNPDEETWKKYVWELIYLGDDLVQADSLGNADTAAEVFARAAELFRNHPEWMDKYPERYVYTLHELGLAYSRTDRNNDAILTLEKAAEAAEAVEEKSLLLRRYHALALCELGAILQAAGHGDRALAICQRSMQLAEQLLEEDDSTVALHLLARVSYQLANLENGYGHWKEAETNYKMALYLMGKVIDPIPETGELLFLAECLLSAGQHYEIRKKPQEALTLYNRSLDICRQLQEVCPTEQLHRRTLEAMETLQIQMNGSLGNKRPRFVKAADDLEAEDPKIEHRKIRAEAHHSWAKACSAGGNHEKSRACFGKVIGLYDTIRLDTGRPEDAAALCAARMDYAEALRVADRWEPMSEQLTAVIQAAREALEVQDLASLRRELARAHTYRGRFYQHLEGSFYEMALECFMEALPLWEQLAQETNHLHMRLFCAECKADIAICHMHFNKENATASALEYSTAAASEMESLLDSAEDSNALLCAKKCFESHAMVLNFSKNDQEALRYHLKVAQLLEKLEDFYESSQYRYECAQNQYLLGEVTTGKQRRQHLKKAQATMEELCRQFPFNSQYKQTLALITLVLKKS